VLFRVLTIFNLSHAQPSVISLLPEAIISMGKYVFFEEFY